MNTYPTRRTLCAGLAFALIGTSSCGLPRSGPRKGEILAGSVENNGTVLIVGVNDRILRQTAVPPALGFPARFLKAPEIGSDTINPGDTLSIAIWENVDDGVMGKRGSPTALQNVQVDGAGDIFIPYAGQIHAAGSTPEQLRGTITQKLQGQTPDPQVSVSRSAGNGATVSVMGAVGQQGVYPIERPTRSLAAMLARAGGVSIKPEVAKVTVTRNGDSAAIWLRDLYRNPKLDIALRGGDVILVEQDPRAFTALGATGAQQRVAFPAPEISAIDAIAAVGGLSSGLADPTGIFVYRNDSQTVARRVTGRQELTGMQRVVYVLNLTTPEGMFLAREFQIRDGDTVYVTEAPYVQWQKSLSILTGSATSANALNNIATGN